VGRESGVLVKDDIYPVGCNWQELAMLRFADEVGRDNLYLAMGTFGSYPERPSPMCKSLFKRFNAGDYLPFI